MDFQSEILDALHKAIPRHLKMMGDRVFFGARLAFQGDNSWARSLLYELISSELIKGAQLMRLRIALADGIVLYGLQMHDQVREGNIAPDHVASPEALAYALLSGQISRADMLAIKFDHGETLDQFLARAAGLIDKVMQQLATEPERASPAQGNAATHVAEPHN